MIYGLSSASFGLFRDYGVQLITSCILYAIFFITSEITIIKIAEKRFTSKKLKNTLFLIHFFLSQNMAVKC